MTRELLVLRHGKSEWSDDALADFDRPLAKRGREAVERMGRWVRKRGLTPDRIVSSPAKRAEQTALRLCRFAGLAESIIARDEAIYDAGLEALLGVLARHGEGGTRIMLVGHNPGLEALVAHLAGEPLASRGGKPSFPTAALARLEMPDDWRRLDRGCASLASITQPKELEGDD